MNAPNFTALDRFTAISVDFIFTHGDVLRLVPPECCTYKCILKYKN